VIEGFEQVLVGAVTALVCIVALGIQEYIETKRFDAECSSIGKAFAPPVRRWWEPVPFWIYLWRSLGKLSRALGGALVFLRRSAWHA